MKNVILLATALITVSASAQAANLAGKWSGKGTAVNHEGKNIVCENVVLTISHSATAFSVNSEFTCEGQNISVPGGTVEVRGNELFDKSGKVGTISDSAISLVLRAQNYIMQSNASFNGNAMNLRSVVSLANNPANPVLKFESALKR